LAHLPLDIHTLILELLSPSDIIALRKTCKALLEATTQRVVWVDALQRMCDENTIYSYSYPTEGVSLLELEYTCMAPERWARLARKHTSIVEEVPSHMTRILTPPHPRTPQNIDSPDQLYLIPGGRFLVTLLRSHLSIWDL
ncbi:hypothetical protein BDZ97DRAFT_1641537, partial [Flammula alnicola]